MRQGRAPRLQPLASTSCLPRCAYHRHASRQSPMNHPPRAGALHFSRCASRPCASRPCATRPVLRASCFALHESCTVLYASRSLARHLSFALLHPPIADEPPAPRRCATLLALRLPPLRHPPAHHASRSLARHLSFALRHPPSPMNHPPRAGALPFSRCASRPCAFLLAPRASCFMLRATRLAPLASLLAPRLPLALPQGSCDFGVGIDKLAVTVI